MLAGDFLRHVLLRLISLCFCGNAQEDLDADIFMDRDGFIFVCWFLMVCMLDCMV